MKYSDNKLHRRGIFSVGAGLLLMTFTILGLYFTYQVTLNSTHKMSLNSRAASCSCTIAGSPKDNFCGHPPNTPNCPMTNPGGYCDPNKDGSYSDGNWAQGLSEYKTQCGSPPAGGGTTPTVTSAPLTGNDFSNMTLKPSTLVSGKDTSFECSFDYDKTKIDSNNIKCIVVLKSNINAPLPDGTKCNKISDTGSRISFNCSPLSTVDKYIVYGLPINSNFKGKAEVFQFIEVVNASSVPTPTTGGGTGGGSSCMTGLNVSATSVTPGGSFTCSFDFGTVLYGNHLNCTILKGGTGQAASDGGCSYSGTNGHVVSFNCTAPTAPGNYDIQGILDPLSKQQNPPLQTPPAGCGSTVGGKSISVGAGNGGGNSTPVPTSGGTGGGGSGNKSACFSSMSLSKSSVSPGEHFNCSFFYGGGFTGSHLNCVVLDKQGQYTSGCKFTNADTAKQQLTFDCTAPSGNGDYVVEGYMYPIAQQQNPEPQSASACFSQKIDANLTVGSTGNNGNNGSVTPTKSAQGCFGSLTVSPSSLTSKNQAFTCSFTYDNSKLNSVGTGSVNCAVQIKNKDGVFAQGAYCPESDFSIPNSAIFKCTGPSDPGDYTVIGYSLKSGFGNKPSGCDSQDTRASLKYSSGTSTFTPTPTARPGQSSDTTVPYCQPPIRPPAIVVPNPDVAYVYSGTYTVSWAHSTGADHYSIRVYDTTTSSTNPVLSVDNIKGTSHPFTYVFNHVYDVVVTPYSACGSSGESARAIGVKAVGATDFCVIQGFKHFQGGFNGGGVNQPYYDQINSIPVHVNPPGNSSDKNPYFIQVPGDGTYTVNVDVPTGFTVESALCATKNCKLPAEGTKQTGSTRTGVLCPKNSYTDLWWNFNNPTITPASSSGTINQNGWGTGTTPTITGGAVSTLTPPYVPITSTVCNAPTVEWYDTKQKPNDWHWTRTVNSLENSASGSASLETIEVKIKPIAEHSVVISLSTDGGTVWKTQPYSPDTDSYSLYSTKVSGQYGKEVTVMLKATMCNTTDSNVLTLKIPAVTATPTHAPLTPAADKPRTLSAGMIAGAAALIIMIAAGLFFGI